MLKAKDFQISGSNIENLGGEEERSARISAARTEGEWAQGKEKAGLTIWRIENFKVVPIPESSYGEFYSGDSYILLHGTDNGNGTFSYCIHYWIGNETSTDEAGTSAYKSVELDDFLGTSPVQYREVQGHESPRFLSYFPTPIRILEGGVQSGFQHVKPEEYQPRLLHVKGKKHVRVAQVLLSLGSLNEGDVFILDKGLRIIQWNGSGSGPFERNKAASVLTAIDELRGSKTERVVVEQGNEPEDFWSLLGGRGPIAPAIPDEELELEKQTHRLFRLSDASGALTFTKEAEGEIKRSHLDSNDVFVLDTGIEVFVWVGAQSNLSEKQNAIKYALAYLAQHDRPLHISISRVFDGKEPSAFSKLLQ